MANTLEWEAADEHVFVDRDNYLETLKTDFKSCAIWGGSGMGKTTLLMRAADALRRHSHVVPLYLDCASLPATYSDDRTVNDEIWLSLAGQLKDAVAQSTLHAKSADDTSGRAFVRFMAFAKCWKENNAKGNNAVVVVMLDNVGPIISAAEGKDFFTRWNALIGSGSHQLGGRGLLFRLVVTGARELGELSKEDDGSSPIMLSLASLELRLFDQEKARELIRRCAEAKSRRLSVTTEDRVYRETGGHPALIQRLMQMLLDFLVSGVYSEVDAIDTALSQLREQYSRDLFQRWWQQCGSGGQQLYLHLVAGVGPNTASGKSKSDLHDEFGWEPSYWNQISRAVDDLLRALQYIGIATEKIVTEGNRTYSIYRCSGDLFREWFASDEATVGCEFEDESFELLLGESREQQFDFERHRETACRGYTNMILKYDDLLAEVRIRMAGLEDNSGMLVVQYRRKEQKSFVEKACRSRADDIFSPKYLEPLKEVTDIVGVRVIALLLEDVRFACEFIELSFEVVERFDKAAELCGEKLVGYRSVHYLCKLSADDDCGNDDNKEYDNEELVFEIQVRTVLQHVWAEVEHDIQYKATSDSPLHTRQRLANLAGMFALADNELALIKKEDNARALTNDAVPQEAGSLDGVDVID